MKVVKWGNSLAVRIPAVVAHELGLKMGDEVDIVAHVAMTSATDVGSEHLGNRQASIDDLKKYRGSLPAGYRFDREEANERRPSLGTP